MSWGQTTFRSGKVYTTPAKIQFQGFLGKKDAYLIGLESQFIGSDIKDLFLTVFDSTKLVPLYSQGILPSEDAQYTYEPLEVFMLKDSIYLASIQHKKLDKSRRLIVHSISIKGKLQQAWLLDSLPIISVQKDELQFITDESESYIALIRERPYTQNHIQEFSLSLFNQSLQLVSQGTIALPSEAKLLRLKQVILDETRFVYLLAEKGNLEDKTDLAHNNKSYSLFRYNIESSYTEEIELQLEQKQIQSIQIQLNASQLMAGGYFSTGASSAISGVFNVLIDPNFSVQSAFVQTFTSKDLAPFYTFTQIKSYLTDFHLIGVERISSGYFALISEQQYKEVQPLSNMQQGISSFSDLYNYNAILFSLFNSKGELIKHICIPKKQITYNDDGFYSSFVSLHHGELFQLFFNDTERNNGLKNEDAGTFKAMSNYHGNNVVLVEIDSQGNVSRKAVPTNEPNYMMAPKLSSALRDQKLYLFNEKGNEHIVVVY